MTALAALTLTTRQRFGQRIEVELGIGPRSRRAADIDNQIDSSLWRQLDEPGRCSASNVPPYRTVRLSWTVYCHKAGLAAWGALRQRWMVAGWTLKVRATSLMDLPS
jgi:hypothetical protein